MSLSLRTVRAGRTRRPRAHLRVRICRNKRPMNRMRNAFARCPRFPGRSAALLRSRSWSHHRAFHSGAVLSVVNALRVASTRPLAGPSGIDDASARHVWLLRDGGQRVDCSNDCSNEVDAGVAQAYVGVIASVPHGTSSVRPKGQRSAHPVGAHRARHRAQPQTSQTDARRPRSGSSPRLLSCEPRYLSRRIILRITRRARVRSPAALHRLVLTERNRRSNHSRSSPLGA